MAMKLIEETLFFRPGFWLALSLVSLWPTAMADAANAAKPNIVYILCDDLGYPSELRRGYKYEIWDGGHRIPFMVRWPGKVKAGGRSDQLISLTDLMATCADILGAKLPDNAGEDSFSILPVLLGTATGPVREAAVFTSFNGSLAIRQGQWKLELCQNSGAMGLHLKPDTQSQGMLYDMGKDVSERKNEYDEHPEAVARLTELLKKYVENGRSRPGSKERNDVPVKGWKMEIESERPAGTNEITP